MYLLNNNRNGRYNNRQPVKSQSVMMPIQHVPSQLKKESEIVLPKPRVKEMLWGEPTWLLFHTLAEKVKDEEFPKIRQELLNHIMKICNNLPCPSCSQHATQYMRKVNFNAIHTVEDLKKMLYIFHNSVNERKKYAEYPYDELTGKYVDLDFNQVVNKFMFHFQQKVYAMNLIAQQISRQKQVVVVKTWFVNNMHIFQ